MARPQITNGIWMKDIELSVGSHMNAQHLLNILDAAGPTAPTDLGVIDLFIYARRAESPLYKFADFDGKSTVYVDNPKGEYSWTLPVAPDDFYVVEDLDPSNTRKGEFGSSFQIKMNKKVVSHSAVITYDKMSGVELYVTEDDIIETGDGHVIYTVKLRNNGYAKYLDNVFLTPRTKWFRATSDIGEYGQRYDEILSQAGAQVLYNYVGNTSANFEYSISTRAQLMLEGGLTAKGTLAVNSIFNVNRDAIDPSLRASNNFDEIVAGMGGADWLKRMKQEGKLSTSFVTKLESAGIQKIIRDNEYDMMFGKGAAIQTGYGETLRSSLGLWQQANAGFVNSYNINTFRLSMFESHLQNFFGDRVEIVGPNPSQKVIVQTGKGGMKLVMPALKTEALGQPGLMFNGSDIGAVRKTGNDPYSLTYGFGFTSYTIPFLANVEFVYNSAFDPIEANDIENPIVNGHRLSSYSFIIFDITEGKSNNIVLLKKKWDNDLRWWYINGKFDYKGQKSGHQSSGGNFGYKVQMEMAKTAVFLKDPTKVLKIVPINPITGRPFGQ